MSNRREDETDRTRKKKAVRKKSSSRKGINKIITPSRSGDDPLSPQGVAEDSKFSKATKGQDNNQSIRPPDEIEDLEVLNEAINFQMALDGVTSHKESDNPENFIRRDHGASELPRFMWRHNNKHRMYWDLLVILLVIYNCVMIPLTFAMPG